MAPVLRPRRHGPSRGPDRGRRRRRRLPQPRRHDPRRRQQGRGRGPDGAGCRQVARPHPVGIELVFTVAEEQGLRGAKALDARRCARALASSSTTRRDRRGDRLDPDPAEDPRRLHRRRGPRRDPARGRQQRDRRRGGGDRADGARPPRRGDDRERRPDRRRHLGQRRPRPLPRSTPRRAASTPSGRRRWRGRSPTPAPGGRASTAATSTCGSRALPRLPGAEGLGGAGAWPRPGCGGPGLSRSGSRPAAAATPTRFCRDGFDCVLLANGTDANPHLRRDGPGAKPGQMLEVCERIVAAARSRRRRRVAAA